jgi:PAS domain S-box-containing protein
MKLLADASGWLFRTDLPSLGDVWGWRPGLVWLHALADGGIAFAYCWIPLVILYVAWRRPDLPFRRQAGHFSAFLIACGVAHLFALWTIWQGAYGAAGVAKAAAALLAVGAALVAIPLVPRGLALASESDLRRADEALREETAARGESDAMLDGLFEFAPDAVIAVDGDGRIVRANAQAEATFGYHRDELDGQPVEVLVPERLRAAHRDHRAGFVGAPRQRGMGAGLRLVGLRKDGTEFPVDISLTPVDVGPRRVVMAVARDLTERRETQRRFRRLLESAPDAVLIVAANGRLVQVNGQAERLFGRPRRELVGSPLELLVPPARRAAHRAGFAGYFAEPRVLHLGSEGTQIFGLAADGREFPIELDLSPLDTEVGLMAIAAIRDLTERRRMEREREVLLAELGSGRERLRALSMRLLEAQEQERRAIARELHDEIGQALTAVRIDLQTLHDSADEATRPVVESALGVTRRLVTQARDLSLDLRPSLLDDLGLTAAIRWYLERHQQRLGGSATLVGDLGDLRIPAALETACFRVAQEALTNIARHAAARSVSVELRRADGEIELAVRDDGVGFDVDAARRRAVAGQSMGILGMEERVVLAGGRLVVDSRVGAGTEVRVWLPIDRTEEGR